MISLACSSFGGCHRRFLSPRASARAVCLDPLADPVDRPAAPRAASARRPERRATCRPRAPRRPRLPLPEPARRLVSCCESRSPPHPLAGTRDRSRRSRRRRGTAADPSDPHRPRTTPPMPCVAMIATVLSGIVGSSSPNPFSSSRPAARSAQGERPIPPLGHADAPLPSGKQRGERQPPACGVAANKHGTCLARPIRPVGPRRIRVPRSNHRPGQGTRAREPDDSPGSTPRILPHGRCPPPTDGAVLIDPIMYPPPCR